MGGCIGKPPPLSEQEKERQRDERAIAAEKRAKAHENRGLQNGGGIIAQRAKYNKEHPEPVNVPNATLQWKAEAN